MTLPAFESETLYNIRLKSLATIWIEAAEQYEKMNSLGRDYRKEILRCRDNAATLLVDIAEKVSKDMRNNSEQIEDPSILHHEYFIALSQAANMSMQLAQWASQTGDHMKARRSGLTAFDLYEEAIGLLESWIAKRREYMIENCKGEDNEEGEDQE